MKITTSEGTFESLQDYQERSQQAAKRKEREAMALFIFLSTWQPFTVQ